MKVGKGEYKLILNPDSILMPRSIVKLVSFIKNTNRVGIVGPMVLNLDGSFKDHVEEAFRDLLLFLVISLD